MPEDLATFNKSFKDHDPTLPFPPGLPGFIKAAAEGKTDADARFASYTTLSYQIMYREGKAPKKSSITGKNLVLKYPPELMAYIGSLYGESKSESNGEFIVTQQLLSEMTWQKE